MTSHSTATGQQQEHHYKLLSECFEQEPDCFSSLTAVVLSKYPCSWEPAPRLACTHVSNSIDHDILASWSANPTQPNPHLRGLSCVGFYAIMSRRLCAGLLLPYTTSISYNGKHWCAQKTSGLAKLLLHGVCYVYRPSHLPYTPDANSPQHLT